ncbi:LUD domain-containing protein [Kitasatospora sp. GP82]|uniref:LutC/YkgG family protein n=1 Tax=Kitasatospora sp. GP82 TaxID=3035089 RepID=UPI002474AC7E|nr:LUD domain-containing protein [Kitasatospora sp. GP82]MDH6124978.1 L-lactate dehydrogenase complex protein LldG [Kitasatospora sp. GP82]
MTSTGRERVLARIRAAIGEAGSPGEEAPDGIPRTYLSAHRSEDPAALLDLLHENLVDYRAVVHRTTEHELPATVARLLAEHGSRTVAVPADLPPGWLALAVAGAAVQAVVDDGALTAAQLDSVDSVLTGCALAVAETGTIVLDAGAAQGRRLLTLVPDHHICVIRAPGQIVASLPRALPLLDPVRPQTWISGPSATSDIELDRVEGVHGPRTLEVVLVTGSRGRPGPSGATRLSPGRRGRGPHGPE